MKSFVIYAVLLTTGFLIGLLVTSATAYPDWTAYPDGVYADQPNILTGLATSVNGPTPRAGPADRITESQIFVYGDRVLLDVENAQWSRFTDTKSMEPVIHAGANALQIVPQHPDEIEVGDIISYRSEYTDGIIIHRVIHKGEDQLGTYFIAKGDNLPTSDPGRIRFEQIERVVIAIIY